TVSTASIGPTLILVSWANALEADPNAKQANRANAKLCNRFIHSRPSLPLWERDGERGAAVTNIACVEPLSLTLSRKGRGNMLRLPIVSNFQSIFRASSGSMIGMPSRMG